MSEPGALRDLDQGQLGLLQQLAGTAQSDADDLVVDAAAEEGAKSALKDAARKGHAAHHVVDVYRLAAMLPDVAQRLPHAWILDRQGVRRHPSTDPLGGQQDRTWRGLAAAHQAIEEAGCLVADLPVVGPDARQRRVTDLAERLVVVDADHAQLV